MEYVYFITDNHGHMKIGKAKEPFERLKALQIGNPYELEIYDLIEVKPHKPSYFDSVTFEKMLHRMFSKYKVRNEWFMAEPIINWLEEVRKDAFVHPKSNYSLGCFYQQIKNFLWVYKVKVNTNVSPSHQYKLYITCHSRG